MSDEPKQPNTMFSRTSHILFPAIKLYGLSVNLQEVLLGVFAEMQVDHVALVYTLAIEGLFVFFKTSHIEVPAWAEALQDLF